MKLRRIAIFVGLISLAYALIITALNIRHAADRPKLERQVLENLQGPEIANLGIVFYEIPTAQIGSNRTQRSVGLMVGNTRYSPSKNVWVNMATDMKDYRQRYMDRFELGWLEGNKSKTFFVIETLQGSDELLAEHAQMQLWRISSESEVKHVAKIARDQAITSHTWRALFRVSHEAPARAIPALAAFLLSLTLFSIIFVPLFREGLWGITCTFICFLVPVMAGAPMLATFGWGYIAPALVLSFIFTAVASAILAKRVRPYRPQTWLQRIVSALVVPSATVLVGVLSAVSLASISILPVSELGQASPADLLAKIITKPTKLLFEESLGIALLLAFAGGLYRYTMDAKSSGGRN